jgi:hypothetical protein
MVTIYFYKVQNDRGQELLDRYLAPICRRLGARLVESRPRETRADSVRAQRSFDFVLWDCSVEKGHVYHAFNEGAKNSSTDLIVSRSPLPRNVLARQQCAPIHGEQFSNEELGEWLEARLRAAGSGQPGAPEPPKRRGRKMAGHYWMFDHPADVFLSFRGSRTAAAERWSERLRREKNLSVRMVPKNEYAYATECVTLQQMWEGVARLTHEMTATKNVAVFFSEDYFDSFWTSSELLSMIKHRGREGGAVERGYLIPDESEAAWQPLRAGGPQLPVRPLTDAQSKRLFKILNNSDPLTTAPDTQVPPQGLLGNLLALVLRPTLGYYDPEFMGDNFWKMVRVPCPHCRPRKRRAQDVDWDEHLTFRDAVSEVDYFGYFPVAAEQLARGTVRCPGCRHALRLKNVRPPRTLWAPLASLEKNRERPVIEEHPVWEVVAEGGGRRP